MRDKLLRCWSLGYVGGTFARVCTIIIGQSGGSAIHQEYVSPLSQEGDMYLYDMTMR